MYIPQGNSSQTFILGIETASRFEIGERAAEIFAPSLLFLIRLNHANAEADVGFSDHDPDLRMSRLRRFSPDKY